MDSAVQDSYILPDLLSILPYRISVNPHFEQAVIESSAWLHKFVDIIPPHKRAFFEQRGSELLSGYTYHYADPEALRAIMEFINLLFVYDDIGDDQNGKEAHKTGLILLNAFRGENDGSPLAQMVHEVKRRLCRADLPASYARVIKLWEDYVSSNIRQAELRERCEILDLNTFTPLRRDNSAVPLCIGVIAFVIGIDIPDEMFEHPIMTKLYLAAADMVWLSNDLYSYNREQEMGLRVDNILTVLMANEKCSLQTAVDHVASRFAELMEAFRADKARLPSWGPDLDVAAQKYVHGMESWVIGSCQWSLLTQRYFGSRVEEVKCTRAVKLACARRADPEQGCKL